MSCRMIPPFSWARTASRKYRSSLVTTPTRVSSGRAICPRHSRTIARSSARDFPRSSLTPCSRGIRQRQTPRSQWRRRCWTASHDSSRPRYSRLARFRKSATSTCIGFRVSRRPAARPGAAPRIPPKSRTSSTTRMGTPHSSKRSIAPCPARWPTRGCNSPRQEIQTVQALPQWPAYRSPDYRLLDFGDA